MVPIIGLQLFKGVVVVISKQLVQLGEGFGVSGLISGWVLKPAEQIGVG